MEEVRDQVKLFKVFVSMPYGNDEKSKSYWDMLYESIKKIEGLCDERGYKIEFLRADEIPIALRLTDNVKTLLNQCQICLAVITGSNPNVFWEIGYSESREKPIIILIENSIETNISPVLVAETLKYTYDPKIFEETDRNESLIDDFQRKLLYYLDTAVKIVKGMEKPIPFNILDDRQKAKLPETVMKANNTIDLITTNLSYYSDLKKFIAEYMFNWEAIPGIDSLKFIDFLKENYKVNWVESDKIEKKDKDKTIMITAGKNKLTLSLINDNKNAELKIDDIRTAEFKVENENNKLNIYTGLKTFAFDPPIRRNVRVRILTLNPESIIAEYRAKQLGREHEVAEYREELRKAARFFYRRYMNNNNVDIRIYDDLPSQITLIVDQKVSTSFVSRGQQARYNIHVELDIESRGARATFEKHFAEVLANQGQTHHISTFKWAQQK
jgi:hypothetical protein